MPTFGCWPAGEYEHHTVVVGAGIGGLSAAATLAARGLKVLVVEAHDRPGGYCSSWLRKVRGRDGSVGRYVFDAGVQDFSGLGPRGPLRRLLDGLGVRNAWIGVGSATAMCRTGCAWMCRTSRRTW